MEPFLATAGLAAVLFAATNVDDLFVLLAFFADRGYRGREVVAGQFLGVGLLYGASVAASLAALVDPVPYVGLLGLAPIVIGCKKLHDRCRGRGDAGEAAGRRPGECAVGRALSVAAVTVANGGDNVGTYTLLFATRSGPEVAVIGLVFVLMTGVWCGASRRMVEHPRLGAPIRRYGPRVVPLVLVGLGALILAEAGSLGLLRG